MPLTPGLPHFQRPSRKKSGLLFISLLSLSPFLFFPVLLFLVGMASPFLPDNGALALAVSVDSPSFDARLADWPEETATYSIVNREWGEPLSGEDDLQAGFRAGYSAAEQALYVMVAVEDDSSVLHEVAVEEADWDSQDGCELFIYFPEERAPIQYYIRGAAIARKDELVLEGELEVDREAVDGGYRYEWRVDLAKAARDSLANFVGRRLGFDVAVIDRDEDGSGSWLAWGGGSRKHMIASNMGSLLLPDRELSGPQAVAFVGSAYLSRLRELLARNVWIGGAIGLLIAVGLFHFFMFFYEADIARDEGHLANLQYAQFSLCWALLIAAHYGFFFYDLPLQQRAGRFFVTVAVFLISGYLYISMKSFLSVGRREPYRPFGFIDFERTAATRSLVLKPFVVTFVVLPSLAILTFIHGFVYGSLWVIVPSFLGLGLVLFAAGRAAYLRIPGAWILLPGCALFVGIIGYQLLTLWGALPFTGYYYVVGVVGLVLSISLLTARNFFEVAAESARKSQELEQARRLQLSMLPEDAPKLPHLDIAWYMETATEVGGDYYDYSLAEDGGLTLTLGDATGHGLQSGTVVTATKSLFHSLADRPDIVETFQVISRSLKGMNFPRLGMAMVMLKIETRRLRISSAGMPPVLLYRAASGQVEEFEIGGMPLGYALRPRYEQRECELQPGDALVLMSDGLPERLNHEDEELGYPRTQELFREVADQSPADICQHLAQGGESWAAGRLQDDDVTFVALKCR